MRLRFDVQDIAGGCIEVADGVLHVNDAGKRALFLAVMTETDSAREVESYLGFSRAELRRYTHRPDFPRPILVGDEWRWLRFELDEYADANGF